MLRLNNALYFVASGFGDEDLVIIKTDLQRNDWKTIIQDQSDGGPACNDPHLLLVDRNLRKMGTSGTNKSIRTLTSNNPSHNRLKSLYQIDSSTGILYK